MCRAPSTRGRGSYGTRSGPPGAATLSCKLGAPYLNLTSASRLDVTGVSPRVGRHQVAQGSLEVLADDRVQIRATAQGVTTVDAEDLAGAPARVVAHQVAHRGADAGGLTGVTERHLVEVVQAGRLVAV